MPRTGLRGDKARRARGCIRLLVGQKLHRDRREIVGQVESEHLGIKGELSFQRSLHIRQLTKSMSLALEYEISVRNSLPPQCVDHLLRLGDWDDHVVGALKNDSGRLKRST